MAPAYLGQTDQHQINLLDNVSEFVGHPINGKLTLKGDEKVIQEIDSVTQEVRVGLQTDCRVMYGRDKQRQDICLIDASKQQVPVIDQCHVAAVNWNSLAVDHNKRNIPAWIPTKQQDIYVLSRTMLRAAYEGVYLAALVRRRKNLYLTLIGGGVFGNPNQLIAQELARVHKKWANHPACCLAGVYLCAYKPKDNVEDFLEQEGIEITRGGVTKKPGKNL